MNFLLRTPFFRLLLALIAGIITFRFFRLYDLTLLAIAVPAFSIIVLSFVVNDVRWSYRLRWGFGAGVIVLVYLLGYLVAHHRESQLRFSFTEEPEMYRLELASQPELKERSVLVEAVPEQCSTIVSDSLASEPLAWLRSMRNAFRSVNPPRVLVYLRKDSAAMALHRGDVLMARVQFQRPQPVQNPEGFDYAAYLHTKGIAATAFVDSTEWKWWSASNRSSLLHWAELSRISLLEVYRQLNLSVDEFAVLAALTLGYKDELEPEVMAHYSASGAMHVLSVSGLHVGVIYLIVNSLLSLFFRRPSLLIPKTIVMVVMLWVYAFITGLSPSVVRASAMFSLVSVGKALERHAQIYNTISSTGFILLIYNPFYLYDVGFQLSYTAVLGIVYFQPKLSPLLTVSNKALKWLWDLTSVSLAAQIGTLPLSLFYFNQFPNYFLLTNYIAIPLSTFIIYAAVVYLGVFFIPVVNGVAGWVLSKLLLALNTAIASIHALPGSVAQVYAGTAELAAMVVVLACYMGYVELKRYFFIPLGMGMVVLILGYQLIIDADNLRTVRMVFLADRTDSHLLLSSGRSVLVYTSDSTGFVKQAGKYLLKNGLRERSFHHRPNSYLTKFDTLRIAVINDSSYRRMTSSSPLAIDYLIVQHFRRQKVEHLMSCFSPQKIIVGAGVSEYYAQLFRSWCKDRRKEFYSVAESGAYVELLPINN